MSSKKQSQVDGPEVTVETTLSTYRLLKQIGQGGTALVWLAVNEDSEQFAVKVLRADNAGAQRMRRHRNELRFCEKPRSPNILQMVDSGFLLRDGKKQMCFVMPLYACTLRTLMAKGIAPADALPLFSQILAGMEAAHAEGVVHRDLKPENILWDPAKRLLLVSDFGIARFAEEDLYSAVETAAADRLANFVYAAPEQRRRGTPVGPTADIYALGLILNEMFTGEVPQGSGFKTVASVAQEFRFVDPVVDRMVRQDPRERYENVVEILKELTLRAEQAKSAAAVQVLRETRIAASDVANDLVTSPPKVVGFDYQDGTLVLKLDKIPSQEWVTAFRGIGNFQSYMGGLGSPQSFSFHRNEARIQVDGRSAQQVADWFKGYLPVASQELSRMLLTQLRHKEQREREILQSKIAAEEQRQQVLGNLKI